MRNVVAVILGAIFFLEPLLTIRAEEFAASRVNNQDLQDRPASKAVGLQPAAEALRQRLLETPSGSTLDVRMLNKQKVRGQLQGVSTENFILQIGDVKSVQTQEIKFEEVKSIRIHKLKVSKSGGSVGAKIGKGVLWGLAAVGILFLLAVIGYYHSHY